MARLMQSLDMTDARQVMINNAVAPAAISAPEQMGMLVGGNILQGPAAQAYHILSQQPRMQLRQLREWIQAFTDFQTNNKYVLRSETGQDLFYIREKSECWERMFLRGQCKAWRMDIYLLGPQGVQGGEASMIPFMHMERPCTLTCMHLNRPVVEVSELPSRRVVGYIHEPFTFCNLLFEVLDANRTPMLTADGGCCKAGLICPLPCEGMPCQQVDFPVADIANGSKIAEVRKHWMFGDFCQCANEWDNYWVDFGQCVNPDYKVLLLSLAVFIQMRLFDQRNQDKS